MSHFRKIGLLAALAVMGCCGLSACFVDSGSEHCVKRYNCHYECVDHTYVETVCSGLYCDDNIITVQECGDVCSSYYTDCRYDDGNVCYRNRDCGYGEYCSNGQCHSVNSGSARQCESCRTSADCYGSDNACVLLGSGEQVCLTGCNRPEDCGMGYRCQVVGDMNSSQSVQQCVPNNESCDPNYCVDDLDCDENGSCVNNRCELAITNLNECSGNRDCIPYYEADGLADYALCIKSVDENDNPVSYCSLSCYTDSQCGMGYSCYLRVANDLNSGACYRAGEKSCVYDNDCENGMLCSDGRCSVACSSDSDCVSQDNGFRCMSGVCKHNM